MLQKTQRLTRAEFDAVFKTGQRVHSPSLTLIHEPGAHFHASVVVGKKVAKTAVARNTLRRRLYGVLYRLCREEGLSGTYILITKPSLKDVPRRELPGAVRDVVGRITK